MLGAFGYVCLGPNAAIEASVFTKFGGLTAMAIMPLIPYMMRQSASGWATAASARRPSPGWKILSLFPPGANAVSP